MRTLIFVFLVSLMPIATKASDQDSVRVGGRVGLGIRTAYNYFPEENSFRGWGSGGHWKLGFGKKVNTEWFFDHIQSSDGRAGRRKDYHIGWAVQFSPLNRGFGTSKPVPYLMGGQCFDLTRVVVAPVRLLGTYSDPQSSGLVFSAAVQAGIGMSWFISPNLESNLQLQYMMHLGKDVHVDYDPMAADKEPELVIENKTVPEGHLLGTLSFTYYFLRLWKK